MYYCPWQKGLSGEIKHVGLEMGRVSWIIQLDPIEYNAFLTVKNLCQPQSEGGVTKKEGLESCTIAAWEDGGRRLHTKNCG